MFILLCFDICINIFINERCIGFRLFEEWYLKIGIKVDVFVNSGKLKILKIFGIYMYMTFDLIYILLIIEYLIYKLMNIY